MKIRLGFVTNSSSSSFILAKHKDCTREEITEMLIRLKEDIINHLINIYDYLYDSDEEIEECINKEEFDTAVDILIKQMTEALIGIDDIELYPWKIELGECSSESDDFMNTFLYYFGYKLGSEHFKVVER